MPQTELFDTESLEQLKARRVLQRRLDAAEEANVRRNAMAAVEGMVITDALQYPRALTFLFSPLLRTGAPTQYIPGMYLDGPGEGHKQYKMHAHALGQLCTRIEYPREYYAKLASGCAGIEEEKRFIKLEEDINWHLKNLVYKDRRKVNGKYMIRIVGDTIMGVVSSSFKRHLASKPLLYAFLDEGDRQGLLPYASDMANMISYEFTSLSTEVHDARGTFLALGVRWNNSDFGAGSMRVSTVIHHIKSGITMPTANSLCSVHIGPVVDSEGITLSDTTIDAELQTQCSAVKDAVRHASSKETADKVVHAVEMAQEAAMTWEQIRRELSGVLTRPEFTKLHSFVEGSETLEFLPPVRDASEKVDVNRLWVSQLVAVLAGESKNVEHADKVLQAAGNLLVGSHKAA